MPSKQTFFLYHFPVLCTISISIYSFITHSPLYLLMFRFHFDFHLQFMLFLHIPFATHYNKVSHLNLAPNYLPFPIKIITISNLLSSVIMIPDLYSPVPSSRSLQPFQHSQNQASIHIQQQYYISQSGAVLHQRLNVHASRMVLLVIAHWVCRLTVFFSSEL